MNPCPKPKTVRRKGPRIMPDGREICTPAQWTKRSDLCCIRDEGYCQRCPRFVGFEGEAHHKIKRGMGGGFRDDRLENLEWLCKECHRVEEASGNRTKMKA